MKIRIKFRKYGNLKYIAHLDVQRYFQKAIRRAEIDVCYTAGFSPHQIMSFASPLAIGLESNGEYMDLEVNSFPGEVETVKRLNDVGVEGIEILSARVLPEGSRNAMASVAAAGYTIRFRDEKKPDFDWKEALPSFMEQPAILITKETKRSTAEVDLKQGIYEWNIKNDTLYLLLNASSSGNIKPSLIMEAFLAFMGEKLMENSLLIVREDMYTNTGDEAHPVFITLEEVGIKE